MTMRNAVESVPVQLLLHTTTSREGVGALPEVAPYWRLIHNNGQECPRISSSYTSTGAGAAQDGVPVARHAPT